MTTLLELKEKIMRFYGKNEAYALPVIRFVIALMTFILINANIGYMESLSSVPVSLILALVCSILPMNVTVLIAGVLMMAHFYALSLEVCLVAFVLLILLYLIYFRFSPKCGYNVLLLPICYRFHIPYIMPACAGLLQGVASVFSVVCGTLVFFFVKGIHENATTLGESVEGTDNIMSKLVATLNQFLSNKEMYLVTAILGAATIIVYLIRRMEIDYSWRIAWISGISFQGIGLIAGYMMLGMSDKILSVVIGCIISAVIAFVVEFVFCALDYTRVERLQFEDDEYYYYVKAVPKALIAQQQRNVKRFSGSDASEKMSKRKFAEEMDIDEELLD